jgi:hypothetical protein
MNSARHRLLDVWQVFTDRSANGEACIHAGHKNTEKRWIHRHELALDSKHDSSFRLKNAASVIGFLCV